MINHADIQVAYQNARNYPDLVSKLIAIGILSYTVDVVTGIILYRLAKGENILHFNNDNRNIEATFSKEKTVQAIKNNQQGKTDFPTFINEIANAGVRFYEATLNGNSKRVTYVGSNGSYQEMIPQQ